jgi:hypothetical protein
MELVAKWMVGGRASERHKGNIEDDADSCVDGGEW